MFGVPAITEQWVSNLTATPNITTPGVRLTSNATPHALAAAQYQALHASLPFDVYGITLVLAGSATSATRTDMMLYLAIGAASSEVVILPDFLCGWRGTLITGPQTIYLPFFIPKGTRVSAAIRSLIASDTLEVLAFFHGGTNNLSGPFFRRADAYGTSTATSGGTTVTPGAAGGTEGTAANIGGTTSRAYGAVMFSLNGTLTQTTMTALAYHTELMVGSVVKAEWYHRDHTTEEVHGPYPERPYYINIPAGTQLTLRAEPSAVSGLAHDCALYCFY